jgi:hypothetical protein
MKIEEFFFLFNISFTNLKNKYKTRIKIFQKIKDYKFIEENGLYHVVIVALIEA